MHGVFDNIRGLLRVKNFSIDNKIFKLHYKVTMFFLLACSLLVTQKQYFGDPIDCLVDEIDPDVMDTYCWIHSTFTIPHLHEGKVGTDVAHPGVGNQNGLGGEKHEIKHHKYYQWVTIVLALQALAFYIPYNLWKVWEGGKMKMLVMHLDTPIVDDQVKEDRKKMLVNYFRLNMNTHTFYAFKFFACELLNFVNVILQIVLTDKFLGNAFSSYGKKIIEFSQQNIGSRNDPMDYVFPKVTKCTFYTHGASGSLQNHDGLCVLPLNIFNEKIYIFLWFWFLILAVATFVGLAYRAATFIPTFRKLLLRTKAPLASAGTVENISGYGGIGDWFVLYLLAQNMDPLIYKEFLDELVHNLDKRH